MNTSFESATSAVTDLKCVVREMLTLQKYKRVATMHAAQPAPSAGKVGCLFTPVAPGIEPGRKEKGKAFLSIGPNVASGK